MASPQLEDGYTQIANEILESLMETYLSPNQWQVLLCIIRKTYGFKKKVDWIANCQIVKATGLHKTTVSRALKKLEQKGLINRNGKTIGFQKDWEQWEVGRIANYTKLHEATVASPANNEKSTDRKQGLAIRKPQLSDRPTKVGRRLVAQKKKETLQKKPYRRNTDGPDRYIKQKYGHLVRR